MVGGSPTDGLAAERPDTVWNGAGRRKIAPAPARKLLVAQLLPPNEHPPRKQADPKGRPARSEPQASEVQKDPAAAERSRESGGPRKGKPAEPARSEPQASEVQKASRRSRRAARRQPSEVERATERFP